MVYVSFGARKGAKDMNRVITTATNYAEAVIWIDGMSKKGKKEKQQKRNSRSVDLSEYDPQQTKIQ